MGFGFGRIKFLAVIQRCFDEKIDAFEFIIEMRAPIKKLLLHATTAHCNHWLELLLIRDADGRPTSLKIQPPELRESMTIRAVVFRTCIQKPCYPQLFGYFFMYEK